MIDFTDYTTYLYGFVILACLYFGYDGSYSRQTRYKAEHRATKKDTGWCSVITTVLWGSLYYMSTHAPEVKLTVNQHVIIVFWYLYSIATLIGAYRGAKKLNEEDAQ